MDARSPPLPLAAQKGVEFGAIVRFMKCLLWAGSAGRGAGAAGKCEAWTLPQGVSVLRRWMAPHSDEIGRAPVAASRGVTCSRSCACSALCPWRTFSL